MSSTDAALDRTVDTMQVGDGADRQETEVVPAAVESPVEEMQVAQTPVPMNREEVVHVPKHMKQRQQLKQVVQAASGSDMVMVIADTPGPMAQNTTVRGKKVRDVVAETEAEIAAEDAIIQSIKNRRT